eukprot:SAG31_NODE_4636_length_3080_cov_2.158672_2_plen_293_part_00
MSTAEGDTRLAELHRAKNGSMVGWRRSDGNGVLAMAALLESDGLGTAAILQTSVFCAVQTNATAVLSTSGTGTLFLNGAKIGTDEVYAGLLQQELVIDLSFRQGWSSIQLKTMSHLPPAAAWSATLALITRDLPRRPLYACKVNACADPSQQLAPMCERVSRSRFKTDDPKPFPLALSIGNTTQLFADNFLIQYHNLTRRMHSPQLVPIVWPGSAGASWESGFAIGTGATSVVQDEAGGKLRLYYSLRNASLGCGFGDQPACSEDAPPQPNFEPSAGPIRTAIAESTDSGAS